MRRSITTGFLLVGAVACDAVDDVGFPDLGDAIDEREEPFDEALFDTGRPPPCVDEDEARNDDEFVYLGQVVPSRPLVWCGRVTHSGTSEGQFSGDLDLAYVDVLQRGRLTVDVRTGSAADWYIFLLDGDQATLAEGRGFDVSATVEEGSYGLFMASASGGEVPFQVHLTLD